MTQEQTQETNPALKRNRDKLYNALSEVADINDYDTFYKDLDDDNYRKTVYDYLDKNQGVFKTGGDYDKFWHNLGYDTDGYKKKTISSATGAASSSTNVVGQGIGNQAEVPEVSASPEATVETQQVTPAATQQPQQPQAVEQPVEQPQEAEQPQEQPQQAEKPVDEDEADIVEKANSIKADIEQSIKTFNDDVSKLNADLEELKKKATQIKTEQDRLAFNNEVQAWNNRLAELQERQSQLDAEEQKKWDGLDEYAKTRIIPSTKKYNDGRGWTADEQVMLSNLYGEYQRAVEAKRAANEKLKNGGHNDPSKIKASDAAYVAYNEAKKRFEDAARPIFGENAGNVIEVFGTYMADRSEKMYAPEVERQIANIESIAEPIKQKYKEEERKALMKTSGSPVISNNGYQFAVQGQGLNMIKLRDSQPGRDAASYNATLFLLKDAQRQIDNFRTEQGQRGAGMMRQLGQFGMNVLRGAGQKITDSRTFTFGLIDGDNSRALYDAVDKAEKGVDLTEVEQSLLNAAALNMAVQGSLHTGLGFQAGEVTAESLPFMLEMIVAPEAAAGNSIASRVFKIIMKRVKSIATKEGAKASMKYLGKNSGKLLVSLGKQELSNLGRGALMATRQSGVVEGGTFERMSGVQEGEFNDKGEFVYTGTKDGTRANAAEALLKSFGSQTIENASELTGDTIFSAFGDFFGGMMKIAKGTAVGKDFAQMFKTASTKIDNITPGFIRSFVDVASKLTNSEYGKFVSALKERAHISGAIPETMEELWGGMYDAAFIGDQEWTTPDGKGVLDAKNAWETFITMLPMQVAFGAIGIGGGVLNKGYAYKKYRDAKKDLYSVMTNQRAKSIEDLISSLREDEFGKELGKALSGLSVEQQQAVKVYALAYQFNHGLDMASNIAAAHDANAAMVQNAYADGDEMRDEAFNGGDLAVRATAEMNILSSLLMDMEDSPSGALASSLIAMQEDLDQADFVMMLNNIDAAYERGEITQDERDTAQKFVIGSIRLNQATNGIEQHNQDVRDRITGEVNGIKHQQNGSVVSGTYNGETVYVTSGSLMGENVNIVHADGRPEQVDPKRISDIITEMSPEDEIERRVAESGETVDIDRSVYGYREVGEGDTINWGGADTYTVESIKGDNVTLRNQRTGATEIVSKEEADNADLINAAYRHFVGEGAAGGNEQYRTWYELNFGNNEDAAMPSGNAEGTGAAGATTDEQLPPIQPGMNVPEATEGTRGEAPSGNAEGTVAAAPQGAYTPGEAMKRFMNGEQIPMNDGRVLEYDPTLDSGNEVGVVTHYPNGRTSSNTMTPQALEKVFDPNYGVDTDAQAKAAEEEAKAAAEAAKKAAEEAKAKEAAFEKAKKNLIAAIQNCRRENQIDRLVEEFKEKGFEVDAEIENAIENRKEDIRAEEQQSASNTETTEETPTTGENEVDVPVEDAPSGETNAPQKTPEEIEDENWENAKNDWFKAREKMTLSQRLDEVIAAGIAPETGDENVVGLFAVAYGFQVDPDSLKDELGSNHNFFNEGWGKFTKKGAGTLRGVAHTAYQNAQGYERGLSDADIKNAIINAVLDGGSRRAVETLETMAGIGSQWADENSPSYIRGAKKAAEEAAAKAQAEENERQDSADDFTGEDVPQVTEPGIRQQQEEEAEFEDGEVAEEPAGETAGTETETQGEKTEEEGNKNETSSLEEERGEENGSEGKPSETVAEEAGNSEAGNESEAGNNAGNESNAGNNETAETGDNAGGNNSGNAERTAEGTGNNSGNNAGNRGGSRGGRKRLAPNATREQAEAFYEDKFGGDKQKVDDAMAAWELLNKQGKKLSSVLGFKNKSAEPLSRQEQNTLINLLSNVGYDYVVGESPKFGDFFFEMVSMFGDNVRPYVARVYGSIREQVPDEVYQQMDNSDYTRSFDTNMSEDEYYNENENDNTEQSSDDNENENDNDNENENGTEQTALPGGESEGGDRDANDQPEASDGGNDGGRTDTGAGGERGNGTRPEGGSGSRGGRGRSRNGESSEPGRDTDTGAEAGDGRMDAGEEGTGRTGGHSTGVDERADAEAAPNGGTGRIDELGTDDRVSPELDRSKSREVAEAQNRGDEKVPYRAKSKGFSLQSVMPTSAASATYEVLSQFDDIDEYVREKLGYESKEEMWKHLAAEQVDGVALSIKTMEDGLSMIIGDQTGLGKGRQAASLIRYGVKQGKKPIFFTQKPKLFSDLYRDMEDTGNEKLRPLIINAGRAMVVGGTVKLEPIIDENTGEQKIDEETGEPEFEEVIEGGRTVYSHNKKDVEKFLKTGEVPDGYDYVVVTYSQIQGTTGNYEKRKTALLLAANNNLVIMDESHTAAGKSNTGEYMGQIVSASDGVTFLSATFAKNPECMPLYAIRSVIANANISKSDLIKAIKKGGVPLQSIMSEALTRSGAMIRRERDMTGVVVDWKPMDTEPTGQRIVYDDVIETFRRVTDFQRKYIMPIIEKIRQNLDENQSLFIQGNRSRLYNIVNQMTVAIKTEGVIEEALAALKRGEKPYISLAETNASMMDDFFEPGTNIEKYDIAMTLSRCLDKCFNYMITTVDEGDKTKARYTLGIEELSDEGRAEYDAIKQYVENMQTGLPLSPIDAIKEAIRKEGYSVEEITGRDNQVEIDEEGNYVYSKRQKGNVDSIVGDYNSNKTDVLIINKSGSTGLSIHNSGKFETIDGEHRKRHHITLQPQSDTNDEAQMRGRGDRTGQLTRCLYTYVISHIPAEHRIMMMLKKKLASLDANTTSSAKSEFNEVDTIDFGNKYGSQVIVDILKGHSEWYLDMEDPLGIRKPGMSDIQVISALQSYVAKAEDYNKVMKRVGMLLTSEQEEFYEEVFSAYDRKIEELNAANENDLEIKNIPLDAQTLQITEYTKGENPGGENVFADSAYIEEVDANVMNKPYNQQELESVINTTLDGKSEEEYKQGIIDKIEAYRKEQLAKIEEQYAKNLEQRKSTIKKNLDKKVASDREKYEKSQVEQAAQGEQKGKPKGKQWTQEEYDAELNRLNEEAEKSVEQNKDLALRAVESRCNVLSRYVRDLKLGTYHAPLVTETKNDKIQLQGVVVGFKISDSFSPKTSFVRFATTDGTRMKNIPFNDYSALNSMASDDVNAGSALSGNFGRNIVKEWDSFAHTSGDGREKRYIITGNLLSAIYNHQQRSGNKPLGQITTFTTKDGEVRTGILLPKGVNLSQFGKQVPLIEAFEKISRGMRGESVTTADGTFTFKCNSSRYTEYRLSIKKTNKKADDILSDDRLASLVKGYSVTEARTYWNGTENKQLWSITISRDDNLENVLKYLSGEPYNMTYNSDLSFEATPRDNDVSDYKMETKYEFNDSIESLFDKWNEDEYNEEVAKVVFPLAKRLGMTAVFGDTETKETGGWYDEERNQIKLKYNFFAYNLDKNYKAQVLLHETLHAVTVYAIRARQLKMKMSPELEKAVDELNAIYNAIKREPGISSQYGGTDIFEMIAELANPQFRQTLANMNFLEKVFKKLGDVLRALFKMAVIDKKTTVLDRVEDALQRMYDNFDMELYNNVEAKIKEINERSRNGKELTEVEKMMIFNPKMSSSELNEKNVYGENSGRIKRNIDDYIPFESTQIKSADNVTYDDNGNVIPLSERFNKSNPDIRFRSKGEWNNETSKAYDYIYKSSGELNLNISYTIHDIFSESIARKEKYGKSQNYKYEGQRGLFVWYGDKNDVIGYDAERKEVRAIDILQAQRDRLVPMIEDKIAEFEKAKKDYSNNPYALSMLSDRIAILEGKIEQLEYSADPEKKGVYVPRLGKAIMFRSANQLPLDSIDTADVKTAIADTSMMLNTKVNMVESLDDIPNEHARRAIESGRGMAYYDTVTGEVYVYMPYVQNVNDARKTVLHEVLGHKGLREIIGEKVFDKEMARLAGMLPMAEKRAVMSKMKELGLEARRNGHTYSSDRSFLAEAMDEWLAERAETFEGAPSWFNQIVSAIRNMLREFGLSLELTEDDVQYMLWRSHETLKNGGVGTIRSAVRDLAMRARYGINMKEDVDPTDPTSPDGGGRSVRYKPLAPRTPMNSSVSGIEYGKRILGGFNRFKEAYIDGLRSMDKLQKAIAKETGEPIKDSENAYLRANHLSSINDNEQKEFIRDYKKPLLQAVEDIMDEHEDVDYETLETYLIAKHGIERNDVFAMRDAVRAAENKYDADIKAAQDAGDVALATKLEADKQDYITKQYDKNRENDYAGLTDLFVDPSAGETKIDVEEAERRAEQYWKDFENKVGSELIDNLWDKINATRMYGLEKSKNSGIISKDLFDKLETQFEWYVPLRGFDENTGEDMYDYVTQPTVGQTQRMIKEAKGRSSVAGQILANLLNMCHSAIHQGNRNQAALAMLRLAEQHPTSLLTSTNVYYRRFVDPTGFETWEIETPDVDSPAFQMMTEEDKADYLSDWEKGMKEACKNDPDNYKTGRNALRLGVKVVKNYDKMQHMLTVRRGGVPYQVFMNGAPNAIQAITGASQVVEDGFFTKWMGKITRFIGRAVTSWNPNFVVSNFWRDSIQSTQVSYIKFGGEYVRKYLANATKMSMVGKAELSGRSHAGMSGVGKVRSVMEETVKRGVLALYAKYEDGTLDTRPYDPSKPSPTDDERLFNEFLKNGGQTGFSQMWSVDDYDEDVKKAIKRAKRSKGTKTIINVTGKINVAKALVDIQENFNTAIENTCRFAAYMTSRQSGRSILQSVADAKEVSVNFNRKGSGAMGNALARSLFMFLNATIQGLNQQIQLAKSEDKAVRRRAIAMLSVKIGLGTAVETLGILMGAWAAGLGDDDDKVLDNPYFGISDFRRRNSIMLNFGNKFAMRIDISHEDAAAYGLGVLIADYMYAGAMHGKHNYNMKNFMADAVGQIGQALPIDITAGYANGEPIKGLLKNLEPTAIKPLLDVYWHNEDFLGNKINGQREGIGGNEHLPEWRRVTRKNERGALNEGVKLISELTGGSMSERGLIELNADNLDYLLSSYFGGRYSFFSDMSTSVNNALDILSGDSEAANEREVLRNLPLANRLFVTFNTDRSKMRATRDEFEYYKGLVDNVGRVEKTFNSDVKKGLYKNSEDAKKEQIRIKSKNEYKYLQEWEKKRGGDGLSFRQRYDKLTKKRKALYEVGDEKGALEIQKQINALMETAVKSWEEADKQ